LNERSTSPADVDSVAHLVVEPGVLSGATGRFQLDDANAHHVHRVLRVRSGELVTLTDGNGGWVTTAVEDASSAGWLTQIGDVHHTALLTPSLEVGFALTKADKPEWVIQKLTELGLSSIVPLVAERSVVRWDGEKELRNLARFRAIAREAVQQSRQTWLPAVHPLQSVMSFAAARRAGTVARCDRGGQGFAEFFRSAVDAAEPSTAEHAIAVHPTVTLIVGPEGGWSASERSICPLAVELVDPVLRAETAAIVAGALLVSCRSQLLSN
jgi:16S rRNA (uracil1498-N3)-methyltransferase